MKSIAIIQIYNTNIKNYAEYSKIINSIYAYNKQYYYFCWDYDLVPLEYSVYYNKIAALLLAMEQHKNIEWFLYLDADAIITNDNIDIEMIIKRHPNKEIIFGSDRNGQNNGVFLIKNTITMNQYLKECYENKKYFHEKFPEQQAMFHILLENLDYQLLIGWEPAWFFNAYLAKYNNMQYNEPLWNTDSFILHLQGVNNLKRQEIFQEFLKLKHIYYLKNEEVK